MKKKTGFKVHQITISEMRGGMVKAVATENGREVLNVKFDANAGRVVAAFSDVFAAMARGSIGGMNDFNHLDIPF